MNFNQQVGTIFVIFVIIVGLLSTALLAGCTTTDPCAANPRNMQCFTADELERELNK
jgi:hypothetical protein